MRVGSRLRKLRSTHKGPLSGSKGISVQGRLTEKLMNKLQNLYGIALRQNVDKSVNQLLLVQHFTTALNSITWNLVINFAHEVRIHGANTGRTQKLPREKRNANSYSSAYQANTHRSW